MNLTAMRKKLENVGLLPLRAQAEVSLQVLRQRLDTLLPLAMEESGIDFWLVIAAEYNEDPALRCLFAWDMPTARRVSALMFHRRADGTVRRMSAGARSPGMDSLYENQLAPGGDVWDCVAKTVAACDPAVIGVNESEHFGMCDGLTATLRYKLVESLPAAYLPRLQSAEALCVGYLQRITPLEESLIKTVVEVTQDIIDGAYCATGITPGQTTTTDVEWLMREAISGLECDFWFGPDVDLQRKGCGDSRLSDAVIQPGDLLHCDIGMTPRFVALHSDIQRLAYVPMPGESTLPAGLAALLARGNRFQDIVTEAMAAGKTGNEIFSAAVAKGTAEGLNPTLYTHPLGTYGHGAGPTVGMYDNQSPIPVKGDYRVRNGTCYALELNTHGPLPEWDGQDVYMYLEENICCHATPAYINGRQVEIPLV